MGKYMAAIAVMSLMATTSIAQDLVWKNYTVPITSSFRAVSVVNDKVAWVSGTKGWLGRTRDGGKSWSFRQIAGYETYDFRSLYAFDSLRVIAANAGTPAMILLTIDGGRNWKKVYQNDAPEAFLDGLDFWNDENGLAYGDPIGGRMLLVSTHDGGTTWQELPEASRPELKKGEASFAASGTGLRCYDKKKAVITTGGLVSRYWTSPDNGLTWSVADWPILQNVESGGAYSAIFWGKKGVVVGGDYKAETKTGNHVYLTTDRAKTWTLPMRPTRGLRECVEFLGKENVIAIGPSGCDLSTDGGFNWLAFSDEKGFHVIRKARDGKLIVAAGNSRLATLTEKAK